MVFSSPIFLFWFLPVILFVYHLVKPAHKNTVLLFFSMIFYSWGEGELLLIMMSSVMINYLISIWIDSSIKETVRKIGLASGILFNLSVLGYFKYTNFFLENFSAIADGLGWQLSTIDKLIPPLGISFFTFQAMSYIIDIYRREIPATRSLRDLAFYISFFPQLIAGPIVRFKDIMNEVKERTVDVALFVSGLKKFIQGLAKKVLIANVIGFTVTRIHALPAEELTMATAWLAAGGFVLQLYFDFSGYSDMAIGLGRMFGFHFHENFHFPFISQSIREYWRRWHISLSTWFRDYLYVPLGGNKRGRFRTWMNVWIVFLLTGFWHGAEWNFIIFGAWHGLFLSFERIGFARILEKIPVIARIAYVHLVNTVSLVFFSGVYLSYDLAVIKNMFGFGKLQSIHYPVGIYLNSYLVFTLILAFIFSIPTIRYLLKRLKLPQDMISWPVWSRSGVYGCYLLIFLLCIFRIAGSTFNPFIYFRF